MNFQVLLVVFAVVIATNIHCQAKPQLGESNKSPAVKVSIISKQPGKNCNCIGRRNAVAQNNCLCEQQRQYRVPSKELKDFCQKKWILAPKVCRQFTAENRKKEEKFSMPL